MTGDGNLGPPTVVEGALDEALMQITLADVGAPAAREVGRARVGAQVDVSAVSELETGALVSVPAPPC